MNKFCVIGEKLPHTMSPQIHEMFFQNVGEKGEYGVREFSREEIVKARAQLLEYDGVNVTVPYKQTVMPLLDEISEEARLIGAVNTIKNVNGRLIGYNTDPYGFSAMLVKNGIDVKGKRAVVLGSGGAAKSVIYALEKAGAEVVYVRREEDEVLKGHEYMSYGQLEEGAGGYLLVNTTPLGMFPHEEGCAASEKVFSRFEAAADVVYNPVMTTFVRRALAAGIRAFSGLYMLVAQGIGSQSIWREEEIQTKDIDPIYNLLLRDYFERNDGNIYLIGMMSCGKSTLGKMLARELGREFVDADEYIEKSAGMSIPQMFERGEDFFRERETRAMLELSGRKGLVVAAGGGAVTRAVNCDAMRSSGIVVYVDRRVENIIKDVDRSNRPLLAAGADRLYAIYRERKSLYENCAHFIIDNNGSAEQGLAAIREVL